MKSIFIAAFETSGDAIAANIVPYLRAQFGDDSALFGITGPQMEQVGVQSWLSIEQFNVMGIGEVLRQAPRLLRTIKQLAKRLDQEAPEIILCVDAPDFHIRLIERLRRKPNFCAQVVSPSVWAWRTSRTKRFAKAFDAIYCLFPFEPSYYAGLMTEAVYIGHPSRVKAKEELQQDEITQELFQQRFGAQRTICLLPGSRSSELNALRGDFQAVVRLLQQQGEYHFILPTFEKYHQQLVQWFADIAPVNIITDPAWRYAAMRHADAALNCLGTVELELSLRQTPHVGLYRFQGMDNYLRKLFTFHVAHGAMSNIILARPAFKEYIHRAIDPPAIAHALHALAHQQGEWAQQKQAMQQVYAALAPPEGHAHYAETLIRHMAHAIKNS